MNLSFMDFLFHVPFFCTLLLVRLLIFRQFVFVNIEFSDCKKLILNKASHFFKIIGNTQ
jgi:hypothetical protein